MKTCISLLIFCLTYLSVQSQGWTQLTDIPGAGRFWSASFSINEKIYTGTGRTGFSGDPTSDMWEYSPTTDTWSQVADYPAGNREGADGFGDGTRGYLAFGTQFIQFTNTVYEYIPITNTWEQKTSCPAPFAYSHGFTLNGKYYIGPENGNNKVYAYDFQSDVWSEVAPFPGQDRRAQVAFSANGKGYIGMGMYVFGSVIGDFFSYDPVTDTWEEIASMNTLSDQSCATSINDVGYVFNVGQNGKNVYKYDAILNEWILVSSHPGDRIANATFIGLNNAAYLLFGERTNSGGNIPSQQTWRYIPSEVAVNDITEKSEISIIGTEKHSIVLNSAYNQLVKLSVWSLSGNLFQESEINLIEGTQSISIPSDGFVLINVTTRNGNNISKKCVL